MKKILISIATVAAFTLALSSGSLAHSGNHSSRTSSSRNSYRVCNVRSCTKSGRHTHNGKTYAAHHSGDGHSYHSSRHH